MHAFRLAFLVALLAAVPAAAEEVKVQVEWKTVDFSDRDNRPPVGAATQPLELADRAPAAAPVLPEALTAASAHYASFTLAGKTIHLALCRADPEAEHPDRLAIDRNGDGKLG